MSTHNIPFKYKKENHTKLSQICSQEVFFQGTQERVRNSHGKRAISVRATEVLLYFFLSITSDILYSLFIGQKFSLPKTPENLNLCCKTTLDLWNCFRSKKSLL